MFVNINVSTHCIMTSKKTVDSENNWYDAKSEISEFLILKLTNYKNGYNKDGYAIPNWVSDDRINNIEYTKEEIESLKLIWNDELDKMINSFTQILKSSVRKEDNKENSEEYVQEGLNSFAKYFQHLWD